MSEFKDTIVIDSGSATVKAGFVGAKHPQCIFPNYIGITKQVRAMPSSICEVMVGHNAEKHRGLLNLTYPIQHGTIVDWDGMIKVWEYMYSDELNVRSEEHPVILSEPPLEITPNRAKLAEVFFEKFNVPSLLISMEATLSLYAVGQTTGVVVNCGDGLTSAVPIYKGFSTRSNTFRADLAGRDVTLYLKKLLWKEGVREIKGLEVIREIKEKYCYLMEDPKERIENPVNYHLPDGTSLDIGSAHYEAPEILFDPSLIGEEGPGTHQIIASAIDSSDLDLRKMLYQNIIIGGGTTLIKGFGKRLMYELQKIVPSGVAVRVSAPGNRMCSVWIGGSILGSMSTSKDLRVTKKEFQEHGYNILGKKF